MMHDALCQSADEIFENQRDMVHTKVRYESDEDEDEDDNHDEDEDNEAFEDATPSIPTDPVTSEVGAAGVGATASSSTTQSTSNKTKQQQQQQAQHNSVLELDDFALGAQDSSSRIRYMNDWSGTLHDLDEYESGPGSDDGLDNDMISEELDDGYFERRRQEASDDEDQGKSEVESMQEDGEDEDTFMEVSVASEPMGADSGPGSINMVEDVDSGENNMEKVV
ncbi:hypothetical protein BC939DRAFT_451582 [Gamsiella multidivaricata]|uniref:uncharacterized protein n=1 Tax=Gamsiella multidivaricata TaxID=101098 RepID=UPI00221F4789|nr:uncharacterized protein BC939DRAFT_451582 [Gamsiella multidivaricata]KAI7823278.1 hypothetical protein BC939DRAFT_451582 [Gamsiella multidivaricata]